MKTPGTYLKRLLLAAGLAITVLAPAAFGARSTTAAAPPLTLEPLEIFVGGHEVRVKVRASEEVALSHSLTRAGTTASGGPAALVSPIRQPLDGVRAPVGAGGPIADPVREPVYVAASSFKLTGLSSNTTYTIFVRATNPAGQQITVQQDFTTLKQRVRVTLREINITDDGDWFGDGEPGWVVTLAWPGGSVGGCFPNTD
ncbi:MAG: fibronectin type III domain-containing protein, partial [Dehalococcoidia bacterium]